MASSTTSKKIQASALLMLARYPPTMSGGTHTSTTKASDACAAHSHAQSPQQTATSLFKSADKITLGPSILAVVAIATGALLCVAGYRLIRCAVFVCGFIVGGLAVASAIEFVFQSRSWVQTASWVGFIAGGLVIGALAMWLYLASICAVGAAGGVVLALLIHTSVAYKVSPENPNYVFAALAVLLGVLGAVVALKLERPMLITATSLVGAVLTVSGVGYFAGEFPNAADLKRYRSRAATGDWVFSIPQAWWAYLLGIVVLFAFGMMMQFRKTARNYDRNERRHHYSKS
ncbi:hypothetical protein ATCC90586_005513 [Pythium insidiosum]|nr:hypothetical protein ATCC90586_005513 [Pythium insidiosum]